MKRCSWILMLVSAVVILMAIVAAEEITVTGKDTTLTAETPLIVEETAVSDNLPEEATTQEMSLISMATAERSQADISSPEKDTNGGSSSISNSANADLFNIDTLMKNAQNGPVDVPAESVESHESVDQDMDSEESLTPSALK